MIRPDTVRQLELAPCLDGRRWSEIKERQTDRQTEQRRAFQAVNPFYLTAVLFLTSLCAVPKIKE